MEKASNNQIKQLRKLGQRKNREKERLFFVEGKRAVEQVVDNNLIEVLEIFVSEAEIDNFKSRVKNVFVLELSAFNEVADTENPQGVLAVCKMPSEVESLSIIEETGVIVALDRIQDPGNMGTMIRTASWFGVKAMIVGKGSVDIYNPKVVRSTMGATGVLPTLTGELNPILAEFEQQGWKVLLLDGNSGATKLEDIGTLEKTILVVGNEANGIHPDLIIGNRERVMIPCLGDGKGVESLNAAMALGIALYGINI